MSGTEIRELVETVVCSIVDEIDSVEIAEIEQDGGILYEVTVSKSDVGKLIGKGGRVASALRTLVKASGAKHKEKVFFNVINTPAPE